MIKVKENTSESMKQYIAFLQRHHGYTLLDMWKYRDPFTKKESGLKEYLEDKIK